MSQYLSKITLSAVALLLALAPATAVVAQQVKPVVVVSIAPIEKQRQDASYLAELVGKKDDADGVLNLAPIFLNGIDMKRPSGAYVIPTEGNEFKFVVFVPVTKLETVLSTFKEYLPKPTDVGGGILQFDPPGDSGESVFVKEVKGWAFLSNDKASLGDLPADPVALLGNLPTLYNVAVRANVHDIPEELRKTAIDALRAGFDQGIGDAAGGDDDRELAEQVARTSAKQFERMIEEINQVTVGWGVDRMQKATYVDFTITAVAGSAMERQMALLKDATSKFSGFLLPGASINANGSTQISPEDIEQNVTVLKLVQDRANKEIDNDAGLDPNQRVSAKELIGEFFGVLTDTVKGGKIDYGAALVLDEKKLNFAGGILVSDGKRVEAAFSKLVEFAKNEPEFPNVKLNAGKHGNVTLHTITADIKEEEKEARMLFGEKLNVVVGTAPKAIYLAFGQDGEALMKKAIDNSAAQAAQTVPPSQINVFLKPILKFAASMDESGNPMLAEVVKAAEAAEEGSDEVKLFSKSIPGGAMGRLQVNEGVLKLIGDAANAIQKSGSRE